MHARIIAKSGQALPAMQRGFPAPENLNQVTFVISFPVLSAAADKVNNFSRWCLDQVSQPVQIFIIGTITRINGYWLVLGQAVLLINLEKQYQRELYLPGRIRAGADPSSGCQRNYSVSAARSTLSGFGPRSALCPEFPNGLLADGHSGFRSGVGGACAVPSPRFRQQKLPQPATPF
jgi:hypothetical protein